ncbi:hypothetical protein [Yersinia ruckeri]|uniref:Polymerase nucleotidyl transferase domain-containing protein n=1 Tax=Yersinia ruckeri TaxID=29486 RepID=A0A380SAZ6_YERRU|nr:hypothetical protein [Yersinia ruckeri]KGA48436.1 hypothetical protein DJ39_3448 [Yersinia ruckeri ATCC 29473]MCK8596688.1 hypothetical protein [Yersinia ruckeri]MCK8600015.1 hypothetical protein [Yersinia ruckeri]MCW6612476.1 hypothetical protein [Yersinia ruckeri]MCW6619192.1 hypothetical protein [Yersinia ruckeri]
MKSLVLFGSKARHDSDAGSDIDLLGIYDGEKIKSIAHESVHLFLYPEETILEKMTSGDLFALHLKEESIPLYGEDLISDIFSKFEYKKNYDYEISKAIFLVSEIAISYDRIKNKKKANKKISWCTRTAIIALSAENREPVFSKRKIASYLEIPGVSASDIEILINIKNFSKKIPEKYIEKIFLFSMHFDYIYKDYNRLLNDPFIKKSISDLADKKSSDGY